MTELSERLNEVDPELVERKRKHIAELRYKLYSFMVFVGILFFRGMYTGAVERVRGTGAVKLGDVFTEGPKQVFFDAKGEGGLLNDIAAIEANITTTNNDINMVNEIQSIVQELDTTGKQYTLANCINDKKCENIKPKLLENIPFFRTYIVLNSLNSKKLDFNQKRILKSILEYLLKKTDGTSLPLLGITFGETVVLDEANRLYKLPFTMEVVVANKQELLGFLSNVEQRINFLLPIVYKVEGMNYDIVQYKFSQTVKIELAAFYYDPLIDKKVESETVPAAVLSGEGSTKTPPPVGASVGGVTPASAAALMKDTMPQ